MLSIDTNLLFSALVPTTKSHENARRFLADHQNSTDFVISELVLIELYNLLRNPTITGNRIAAAQATSTIQSLRRNPAWTLVESAPVMEQVWTQTNASGFARRKVFALRLGFTLLHHGVTHFATANTKDFSSIGFEKVWNPTR